MINKILKQAGVDTVEELYNMYPDEASFIAAYPEFAKKMKMGGTHEAFPQTAPMDKFFSYGVPVPPTYHRDGGQPVYPYIQSEAQFFSPVYADIANPYNKEYGGMMEAFPQATPYYNPPRGNAYGFMAEGGQPEEMIGVQNRIGNFMNKIANKATNAQNKEQLKIMNGIAKLGGGLPLYQGDEGGNQVTDDKLNQLREAYQVIKSRYPNISQEELATRAYYELYGSMPQADLTAGYASDPNYKAIYDVYSGAGASNNNNANLFDINQLAITRTPRGRGNIKTKGWIDGEFGRGRASDYMWQTMFNTDNFADAQRLAAEQGLKIDEGKAGLFGRRNKYTYTWGNPPAGNATSIAGQQGSSTNTLDSNTTGSDSADPSGMGFLERMFYQKGNKYIPQGSVAKNPNLATSLNIPQMQSAYDPTGYNADYSGFRNQIFQNRKRRIGEKLDQLYYDQELAKRNNTPYFSNRDEKKMQRLENKYNRIGPSSSYGFNKYDQPIILDSENYSSQPSIYNVESSQIGNKSFADSPSENYLNPSYTKQFAPEEPTAGDYPSLPTGTSTQTSVPVTKLSTNREVARKQMSYRQNGGTLIKADNGFVVESGLNKDRGNEYQEKDMSFIGRALDDSTGLEKFLKRQVAKGVVTNVLNNAQMESPIALTTSAFERLTPTFIPNKGTMDFQNGNRFNPGYKDYAVYDAFAPQYMQMGGGLKSGDVVYWDDDTIDKFIQSGGQVEFLD